MSKQASGKFVLRVPPTLHMQLKQAARHQNLSLNEYCHRLLRQNSPVPLPKTDGVPSAYRSLVDAISKEFEDNLSGIVLFGSAARGELRESSDIDLLLIVNGPVERKDYRLWDDSDSIQSAARNLSRTVNPQLVQLPENVASVGSLWFEVALEGLILWDPKILIHPLLLKIRTALLDGHYVRAFSHGHPYWIHRNEKQSTG